MIECLSNYFESNKRKQTTTSTFKNFRLVNEQNIVIDELNKLYNMFNYFFQVAPIALPRLPAHPQYVRKSVLMTPVLEQEVIGIVQSMKTKYSD